MGIGGISFWQILIILVVILILFGGKKIRTMGSDLGEGLKGFKKAIKDEDKSSESKQEDQYDKGDFNNFMENFFRRIIEIKFYTPWSNSR